MVVIPYQDNNITLEKFVRIFKENVDEHNLVWHRDSNDRIIKIIEGNNWKIQYDDSLPMLLEQGHSYFIPKNDYHRVIQGNDNLIIEIHEI
jgi:hypothetical protein